MNKKRILALLLALCMIAAFAACQNNNAATSGEPAASSDASGGDDKPAGDDEPAGDDKPVDRSPVQLLMGVFASTTSQAETIKDDPIAKIIKEKFNVTMELIDASDANSWEATGLPARVAANDLPDVFQMNDGNLRTQCITQNLIAPLDDYIAEHGPNYMSEPYLQVALEGMRQFSSNGTGKLYQLPSCIGMWGTAKHPTAGNYIRWDVYKLAGYPEMKSYEDILPVLKKMQDAYPTTKAGEKVYAIGGWFADSAGWADWPFTYPLWFSEGIIGTSQQLVQYMGNDYFEPDDGLIDFDGSFWRTIKWYWQANQMGLLDPESFTQKSDQYSEKLEAGRYLYTSMGWVDGFNVEIAKVEGPDAGLTHTNPFTDRIMAVPFMTLGERRLSIAATCADIGRAVEVCDFLASQEGSLYNGSGVPGKDWDFVNGLPEAKDAYFTVERDDAYAYETGAGIYHHCMGFCPATPLSKYGDMTADIKFSEKYSERMLLPFEKDQLAHEGVATYDEFFARAKMYKNYFELSTAIPVVPDAEKDPVLDQAALDFNAFKFQQLFKLVLAKDQAEFDTLQNEWLTKYKDCRMDEKFKIDFERAKVATDLWKPVLEKATFIPKS